MNFVQLTEHEFEAFEANHRQGNFLQSVVMGKRRQSTGWQMHLVGLKNDDGAVVAAALLSSRKVFLGYSDFDCAQGPVLDYDDAEVLAAFLTGLKGYLHEHRALRTTLNPTVLLTHRDLDAELIDDGYSGWKYVEQFEANGFSHQDNAEVDRDPHLFRWFFSKDLSGITNADELTASFDSRAQRSLQTSIKSGVEVSVLGREQLDEFHDVLKHTAERRGFEYRDKSYHHSLAEFLSPDELKFCAARLNTQVYGEFLQQSLDKQQTEVRKAEDALAKNPENVKAQNRLRAAQEAVASGDVKLKQLDELKANGANPILAVGLFISHANEMVFLAGGSYDDYASFRAPFSLHWFAMQQAMQAGITRYNFYGTNGEFSGNPEQHGVYLFKRGFGGVSEERIGYFSLVSTPWVEKLRELAGGAKSFSRKILRRG